LALTTTIIIINDVIITNAIITNAIIANAIIANVIIANVINLIKKEKIICQDGYGKYSSYK